MQKRLGRLGAQKFLTPLRPVSTLSSSQLSERQRKICKLTQDAPFISGERMSVVLSVVLRTIRRDLAAMQKMGVLLREGNTSTSLVANLPKRTRQLI